MSEQQPGALKRRATCINYGMGNLVSIITNQSRNTSLIWLCSTCSIWHKKALRWREEFDKWHTIECQKDFYKQKAYEEIAAERWMSKNIRVELQIPEFEALY